MLCLAGQALSVPTYPFAYRAVAHHQGGPLLRPRLLLRIVVAGFGPFTPRGGFALDKRALHAIDGDEDEAVVRVLGLGALEWARLAPAACLAAIALLIDGDPRPMPSVLWPWALAVPIGFAVGNLARRSEPPQALWVRLRPLRQRPARRRHAPLDGR